MKRPAPLDEKQLDVVGLGQPNADVRQHTLRGLEIQLLGVHEHAIVIPENRLRALRGGSGFLVPGSWFWFMVQTFCPGRKPQDSPSLEP